MTTDVVLPVGGMDCSVCERNINFALTALAGISRARADHRARRVEVSYDPAVVDETQIRRAIEEMGFQVVA